MRFNPLAPLPPPAVTPGANRQSPATVALLHTVRNIPDTTFRYLVPDESPARTRDRFLTWCERTGEVDWRKAWAAFRAAPPPRKLEVQFA